MANTMRFNGARLKQRIRAIEVAILNDFGVDVVRAARAKAPVRKLYKQKRRKYKSASSVGDFYVKAAVAHAERVGIVKSASQKRYYATQLQRTTNLGRGDPVVKVRRPGNRNQALKIGRIRTIKMKVKTDRGARDFASVDRFFSAHRVGAREHSRGEVRDFYNKDPKTGFMKPIKPQKGYTTNERVDAQLSSRGRYEVRSGRAAIEGETGKIQIGGRLKKSITASGAQESTKGVTNNIGTDVEYAIYVEFPTSHNAAQPFLLPALHEQKRHLKPRLEEAFRQAGLKRG